MGFNYLQTDDRDDYFAGLRKEKKKRIKVISCSLINPKGEKGYKVVNHYEVEESNQ